MKGTVPRPQWPAPAVTTATQPQPNAEESTRKLTNEITLALLEEWSPERTKGYDPYNAWVSRPRDAWTRKPRRD